MPNYHMTPDDFRRWGHETVEWVARYMERVEELPVMSTPVALSIWPAHGLVMSPKGSEKGSNSSAASEDTCTTRQAAARIRRRNTRYANIVITIG